MPETPFLRRSPRRAAEDHGHRGRTRRIQIVGALLVLTTAGAVTAALVLEGDPPPAASRSSTAEDLPSSAVPPAPTERAVPGQVGFLGERSSLTVIDGPGSVPPGTAWEDGLLVIRSGDVTLDHVLVEGGIDFYGTGTLTVTESVVESTGGGWAVVMGRDPGGELRISDSTLVWPEDVPEPGDTWGNGAVHGDAAMVLVRNDISGTPDGVQQGTGNSIFEQNYIHDLRTRPWTHNDGIQLYGGPGVVIRGNYIVQEGMTGSENAALFLSDDGDGFIDPVIENNYLSGGGYVLRLEAGCTGADVSGNDFGPVFAYAEVGVDDGASVDLWGDNTAADGAVIPHP